MTDPTDPTDRDPRSTPPPSGPSPNPFGHPGGPGGWGWRPPRERGRNVASIVFGLILLGVGVWYLLDVTLGFEMPRIRWGEIWPVLLIVLGVLMLVRSADRRA